MPSPIRRISSTPRLDRNRVQDVQPGKIYGWRDRLAVRVNYQDAAAAPAAKPQTLIVSFNHAAAQQDFINLLRQRGFVVGTGDAGFLNLRAEPRLDEPHGPHARPRLRGGGVDAAECGRPPAAETARAGSPADSNERWLFLFTAKGTRVSGIDVRMGPARRGVGSRFFPRVSTDFFQGREERARCRSSFQRRMAGSAGRPATPPPP